MSDSIGYTHPCSLDLQNGPMMNWIARLQKRIHHSSASTGPGLWSLDGALSVDILSELLPLSAQPAFIFHRPQKSLTLFLLPRTLLPWPRTRTPPTTTTGSKAAGKEDQGIARTREELVSRNYHRTAYGCEIGLQLGTSLSNPRESFFGFGSRDKGSALGASNLVEAWGKGPDRVFILFNPNDDATIGDTDTDVGPTSLASATLQLRRTRNFPYTGFP